MQDTKLKKDWALTTEAFHHFLFWLDEGVNSEGQKYLEMRRRLVAYFDRKNCLSPEELADETINRVARRLQESREIETEIPAKYCYIMARFVFLEFLRVRAKEQQGRSDIFLDRRDEREDQSSGEIRERMLECLSQCAGTLEPANRDLIFGYYFGAETEKISNRRSLAGALGISANALSIRACRIRDKLELCVRECISRHETIS